MRSSSKITAVLLPLLTCFHQAQAALPDEIAIHTDAIAEPGKLNIELHVNTTPQGAKLPGYSGEILLHHGIRLMPEFSYGINENWEAGFHLPLVRTAENSYFTPGIRAKLKWLPVKHVDNPDGFFLGLNLEASSISRKFEPMDSLEVLGIAGVKHGRWLFALNPRLMYSIQQMHQSPNLALGAKLAREVSDSVSLGAEYYAGLGTLQQQLPFNQQSSSLFAVMDYSGPPFNFNLGLGHGLSSVSDTWTFKTIFEITY